MKQFGVFFVILLLLTSCGNSLNLDKIEPESCDWKTVGLSGTNDDGRVDIVVNETNVTDGCIKTIANAAEDEMGKIIKLTVEIYQADQNNESVFEKHIATLNLTQDSNNEIEVVGKRHSESTSENNNDDADVTYNEQPVEPDIDKLEQEKVQSQKDDNIQKAIDNDETPIIDDTFLSNLAEGKFKYCELPLDHYITAEQIVEKLGTPDYEDYRDGGYGRQYGNCIYFVDSNAPDAHMTAIVYINENFKSTPTEIKNILGEPLYQGINELDNSFFMQYISKGYSASFDFEHENGPFVELFIK